MAWEKYTVTGYLALLDALRKLVIVYKDGTWASTTAYTTGDIVEPTVPNGYRYIATTTGTSAGGEPSWPTTIGNTVVDNTVTWQCLSTKLSATQTWTVNKQTYALPSTDGEIYFDAPGNDGLDQINLNIATYSDAGNSHYSWLQYWATGFDTGLTIGNQPGALSVTGVPRLNISNASLDYWLAANGRRVIVVYFVDSYWYLGYMGHISPTIPPTTTDPTNSWPKPICVAGSHYQYKPSTDGANTNLVIPINSGTLSGSAFIRAIDGTPNVITSAGTGYDNFRCFPYCIQETQTNYKPTYAGSKYPLHPVQIWKWNYSLSMMDRMGVLDGVYWTPASGLSSGNIINDGTYDYLVIQNVDDAATKICILLD